MGDAQERVAVVLSGGGARGAYEAGVLSVLLPALDARNERPAVFVGSSAGAINAAAFASLNHLPPQKAAAESIRLWREVRHHSVYRLRPGTALLALAAPRWGRRRATGLLDSAPLAQTLAKAIDWDQLRANVDGGTASVGVVATACTTHRTSVFLDQAPGVPPPGRDDDRSIDYVAVRLQPRHVLASTAIPMLFPAVEIKESTCDDWYVDGGLRHNTPLKPALALGADRVVVIATDPAQPSTPPGGGRENRAPTIADGAVQVLYAVLADNMVEDLRTLARRNDESDAGGAGPDPIRWLFAGPGPDDAGLLGRLVGEVLAGRGGTDGRHRGLRRLTRRAAGRWLAMDPSRREVLSHLFFDADFIDAALRLGQRDAKRAIEKSGSELWTLGSGRPAPARSSGNHHDHRSNGVPTPLG